VTIIVSQVSSVPMYMDRTSTRPRDARHKLVSFCVWRLFQYPVWHARKSTRFSHEERKEEGSSFCKDATLVSEPVELADAYGSWMQGDRGRGLARWYTTTMWSAVFYLVPHVTVLFCSIWTWLPVGAWLPTVTCRDHGLAVRLVASCRGSPRRSC
jgi:hypothetical protein